MKVLNRFKAHKIPQGSVFYDLVLPGLFFVLGAITFGLIVFAIGIFTGLIAWT